MICESNGISAFCRVTLTRLYNRISSSQSSPTRKMPKKVANADAQSPERDAADAEPTNDAEKSERGQWEKNAAEIDRMIDNNEESKKYEMNEISQEALGQLQGNVPETKKIIIRREDIELIATELETSRTFAENALLKHDGDVKAAIRALVGF